MVSELEEARTMKIQIRNRTHWRTDHIRAFIKRGIRQERADLCKKNAFLLRVSIVYNRGGIRHQSCSGRAVIGGLWMKIMLPSGGVDRVDMAHTIAHELGHTAGLNHRHMEGCATYSRVGNWRELYAWAETLPLEKEARQTKTRPDTAQRLDHARRMLTKALTRERRASTIRKRWERRVRALERYVSGRINGVELTLPEAAMEPQSSNGQSQTS
jgi:hypothetical protein